MEIVSPVYESSLMASVAPPISTTVNERFVLHGVSWNTYQALRQDLGDRPIRLTYDGRNLEIMSPSRDHERLKKLLGRMIESLAGELDIPVSCGGVHTVLRSRFRREGGQRECLFIVAQCAHP